MEPRRDCSTKSLIIFNLRNLDHEAYTQLMFTARKIAQMSAFFAEKQGGTIKILKLMKLLYLSDRESITRYGVPISFDYAYSMHQGPMLSQALDFVDGFIQDASDRAKWDEWIGSRDNHRVSLNRKFVHDDLDELSDANLDVLATVWKQFGHFDEWQLVKYTHENCPEHKETPKGQRNPLSDSEILAAVGHDKQVDELSADIQAQRRLDAIFSH